MVKKVHHVAYRCADAKQTVEWYGKYLGMKFILPSPLVIYSAALLVLSCVGWPATL